jgi:hypothetical protein
MYSMLLVAGRLPAKLTHCKEISFFAFSEKEWRVLNPNFNIHVIQIVLVSYTGCWLPPPRPLGAVKAGSLHMNK